MKSMSSSLASSPSLTPSLSGQSSRGVSRRDALNLLATAITGPTLFSFVAPSEVAAAAEAEDQSIAPAELIMPPLPYQYNALEPAIDRETMLLHHDKHFAKYTEGSNAALAKIPGGASVVDGDPAKLAILLGNLDSIKDESVRKALRNNGGGYVRDYRPLIAAA